MEKNLVKIIEDFEDIKEYYVKCIDPKILSKVVNLTKRHDNKNIKIKHTKIDLLNKHKLIHYKFGRNSWGSISPIFYILAVYDKFTLNSVIEFLDIVKRDQFYRGMLVDFKNIIIINANIDDGIKLWVQMQ